MPLRLSPKLRLAPLWPALAAVLTATVLLGVMLPRLFERHAADHVAAGLDLLAPLIAPRLGARADPEDLQRWLLDVAAGSELRVTVIAASGQVLADSERTRYQLSRMDDHGERPEVRRALATGSGRARRLSATTGVEYAYAARRLELGDEAYVLRLAQPLPSEGELLTGFATTMGIGALAALAIIALISWWLDRQLFRPLASLIAGARTLAAGDYEHRVEVPEETELAIFARALNQLAEGVQRQIAAVRAERDHLRAILASMSEGVLVVDREGRAVTANPAFYQLLEIGEGVEGKRPLEISRQVALERLIGQTLHSGEPGRAEAESGGPIRRTFALTSAALSGPQGGAVVVIRDTSEATHLSQVRRDFVANVSHELKTPLSAIRACAETLSDGALDDASAAERFVGRILEQCRHLEHILGDLLTLSRLEGRGIPGESHQMVDLAAVVHQAAEVIAPAAEERRVALELDSPGEAPPVIGDPEALEQMVTNLLDNAVKYNRTEGRVTAELAGETGPSGRAEAVLTVSDDGIGIPQEDLPRIFERFYRVDKGRSREEGGTGLGLAIVKHVVQVHKGQVEVDSEPGRGTTFRVRLPAVGA